MDFFEFYPLNTPNSNSLPQPSALIFNRHQGKRKRERPKKMSQTQVQKESKSVGLEREDTINQARWRVGLREIAAGVNPATPVYGYKAASKFDC